MGKMWKTTPNVVVIYPSSLRGRWMRPRVDNEKQLYNSFLQLHPCAHVRLGTKHDDDTKIISKVMPCWG
jgi:hypothetical protein